MRAKGAPNPNPARYTYTVLWSDEDQTFIGKVAEFPSLAAHGRSDEAALREIRALVELVLEDLQDSGEPAPLPFGEQHFSGKLNLRIPPFVHRNLVIQAAQQHVSLNQLINLKLEGSAPISLVTPEQSGERQYRRKKK